MASLIKNLTDAQIVRNILDVYNRSTDHTKQTAIQWYEDAHDTAIALAKKYDVSLLKAAGVIAALSPRNAWSRNIKDADAVLNAITNGLGIDSIKVCTFNPNKEKAFLIASTAVVDEHDVLSILNGQKLQNFFLNIYNPYGEGVTVDSHAYNIAAGKYATLDKTPAISPKEYARLVALYTEAANFHEISPCQMQAITWTQWRLENGIVLEVSNSL